MNVSPPSDVSPEEETQAPFATLPDALSAALVAKGFSELTSVQQAVAAADTRATDLRISSQTGSGKTVAVGIAIARQLLDEGPRGAEAVGPSVMVLAPTRELAGQVQKELDWLLAKLPDSTTEVVTGGTSVGLDRKNLSRRPRVLVGTPGRVLDHLRSGVLSPGSVSLVVLDEADQMLDMGFRDELEGILGQLPEERRTHLVSATFSGEVLQVASRFQRAPLSLEGSPLGRANEDIQHIAHVVPVRHRYDALVNILLAHQGMSEDGTLGRVLVFTKTRMDTAEVAERLQRDGFVAEPLSGDMPQASRTRTLEAFRRGRVSVIVATDVAARGLDVGGITLVVHYDPPGDPDALTHRSGRTGRAGQQGTSVLLLPPVARRRVERLLAVSRIKPAWVPVPTPEKIRKLFTKLGRRKLFAHLAGEPPESALAYAQKLLTEHSAEHIIANLLTLTDEAPPCTPRETSSHFLPEHPRPHGDGPREWRGGRRDGGSPRGRGPRPGPGRWESRGEAPRGEGGAPPKPAGGNRGPGRAFMGDPGARPAPRGPKFGSKPDGQYGSRKRRFGKD